jgi:D-alanyl-D-alanine carboxypeptidase
MRFDVVSAWTTVQKKRFSVLATGCGIVAFGAMLTAHAAERVAPTSSGTDWIVMDMSTGRVLSEQGARTERYPASLTKLMTLDLAFEELSAGRLTLDTLIPVSETAARVQPMKLDLLPGQKITVREAILGMTTLSANDAATALGEYLGGGSITQFGQAMTDHARALGMLHTSFRNPSGLPDPGQVVDAYDMAILTRHILLTYPQYRYVFSVQSFNFEGRMLPNLDGMLKRYPGAIGMKTGFTNAARFNVVTAAERAGHLLIGVELHAQSWSAAYGTMAKLLDAGFASAVEPADLLAAHHDALPAADAVTAHPYAAQRVSVTLQQPSTPGHRFAAQGVGTVNDMPPAWTAQIGAYDTYAGARHQVTLLSRERQAGVARVVSAVRHNRRTWQAQLTGLSEAAARATCARFVLHNQTCFAIASYKEEAMR